MSIKFPNMKRFFSLFLAAVMMVTLLAVNTHAANANKITDYGDAYRIGNRCGIWKAYELRLPGLQTNPGIQFRHPANYREIKAWVLQEYGLKVSSQHVTQEGQSRPLPEGVEPPEVPPEIEAAIEAALRHFLLTPKN